MQVQLTFNSEFDNLLENLRKKYPSNLFELEGIGSQTDIAKFSEDFFNVRTTVADVSVDANANVDDISIIAYENELPKPFFRLYSLYLIWKNSRKLYGKDIADKIVEAQISGDIYINDLQAFNKPYCYNFSAMDVLLKGLPFVKKIHSAPPKHLSSFIGQLIHFSVYASNSVAGAVGIADFLIISSYFVNKLFKENPDVPEKYLWKQVEQEIQSFIFSCNQPFRGGLQSGFYNISIYDDIFLSKWCDEYLFPDGSHPNKELVKKLQILYLDLMNKTLRNTPVTFPVVTACFSIDENKNIQDEDFLDLIAEKNLEFAFINIFSGKTSTLSSCCRLRSDMSEYYYNQIGSGGTKLGSIGVCTLDIPRIAIKANKNKDKYFSLLRESVDIANKINNVKRLLLKERIVSGRLPLYTYDFISLDTQFSTIGITGLNEACYFMGLDIQNSDGQQLINDTIDLINELNKEADIKYNAKHNLEQVPAENSAIKLASKDKLLGYQNEFKLYSNQFIPLTVNVDLFDRIKLQGVFDDKMTGGAICHLNVEQRIENKETMKNLLKISAKQGVVYMAVCYNLQKCINGHISVGKNTNCSICGNPITDNFIRVVGFLVNTKNMHTIRRNNDYPLRQFYNGVQL